MTPSSNLFLAVRPTGKPWNEAVNKRALENLNTFQTAYARRFRALIRVKDDKDVTPEGFRQIQRGTVWGSRQQSLDCQSRAKIAG